MKSRIPDHVLRIVPYVPGKPIEAAVQESGLDDVVKLASNENPLGPSPRALEAARDAAVRVNRYPDGSGYALRQALAARHRVGASQVVLGNGSTELVEIVAKTFLGAGRTAVVADRAFIMYRISVLAMNAPLVSVPLHDERHDLEAMARACDARTVLVYVGNPNNPTGTYVGRETFERYFDQVPPHVLTVIDEAYFDYVEAPDYPDGLEFLRAGRNVLVLRTFSKIHGLAGLRIGYGITSPDIARALEAVRSPFNTSSVAQAAALAALEDGGHVLRSRTENAREARFVETELRRRRIDFIPTVANFLLMRTGLAGETLFQGLLARGVIVRPMEAYGYRDAVRVSFGTHSENERFLRALDAVLAEPPESPGAP
ncbi:MAG TPA: histidinol-phosphate transaminase [Dongiaceae bacterium]|nr:histidinol-phosphate transaminase [Dongiaceae bacterium]